MRVPYKGIHMDVRVFICITNIHMEEFFPLRKLNHKIMATEMCYVYFTLFFLNESPGKSMMYLQSISEDLRSRSY